ncbi:protein ESKIMO 1-like isoform X2 [Panicum virgatum]|uniref:protein ESKIMO 1-like isoform X2 n=1 Tax=Panicum virgatum TaxID=38727 RepID=UPI0019D593E3|nr:protein ESKIMO 1-like isoform X2 [Panicum virgatum]
MQHRRKPASAAAPAAAKQPPSRRPTAPLSLAGLVVAVFLLAIFFYNEDVVKSGGGGADVVAVAGRARSPDLRVLHHHHHEEEEDGDADAATQQQKQQPPPPPPTKHQQQCDLYQGRWTFDAAGELSPLYRESECEFLTEQVTCMRNGRRDDSYQKWRWQPNGCALPRFDASLLLERLRNKRLMFVGDSLNRNQWESMVCLVQSVVPRGHKTLQKFVNNGSLNVFTAHEYNATVEFYWAPFLVQSNSDDPQVHSVMDRVIAWRAIAKHANNWKGVDYLVFNTYIWWLNTFEMKVLKGSGALRNNKGAAGWSKYALVDRPVAYREVLKTWAKWVDRHIDPNRTAVFFMGMSPNHITQRGMLLVASCMQAVGVGQRRRHQVLHGDAADREPDGAPQHRHGLAAARRGARGAGALPPPRARALRGHHRPLRAAQGRPHLRAHAAPGEAAHPGAAGGPQDLRRLHPLVPPGPPRHLEPLHLRPNRLLLLLLLGCIITTS